MNNNPLARKNDLVTQNIEDEILIYDLKENRAICLNNTAAEIWQLCDGNKDIRQIAAEFSKDHKEVITEEFIRLAVNQLNNRDLLVNMRELKANYDKLPRRELIKKAGISTAVALPLISSIVAPKAVKAQSCADSGAMVDSAPPSVQSDSVSCFNYCNNFAAAQCCTGDGSGVSSFDSMTGTCTCSSSFCS